MRTGGDEAAAVAAGQQPNHHILATHKLHYETARQLRDWSLYRVNNKNILQRFLGTIPQHPPHHHLLTNHTISSQPSSTMKPPPTHQHEAPPFWTIESLRFLVSFSSLRKKAQRGKEEDGRWRLLRSCWFFLSILRRRCEGGDGPLCIILFAALFLPFIHPMTHFKC